MKTTLEHLEKYNKEKKSIKKLPNLLKEIKVFILIFVLSSFGIILFTNAELFVGKINQNIENNINKIVEYEDNKFSSNSISSVVDFNRKNIEEIDKLIEQANQSGVYNNSEISISTDSFLKNNIQNYKLKFNTLPPINRVVIKKINLDVPLISSKLLTMDEFTHGDFEDDLKKGIVKYPTTPLPGEIGNTLIFGHTSQERRKDNPYGSVLSKMPELQNGDIINLIFNGKKYEYQVVQKTIKKTSQVNQEYLKRQDKDYLTLLGCYPIGKADKRMLIIAQRIN